MANLRLPISVFKCAKKSLSNLCAEYVCCSCKVLIAAKERKLQPQSGGHYLGLQRAISNSISWASVSRKKSIKPAADVGTVRACHPQRNFPLLCKPLHNAGSCNIQRCTIAQQCSYRAGRTEKA